MKKLLLSVCLFFSTVSVSIADDYYLSVKGGSLFPNTDTAGLNYFKTGYNVEVAVGTRIHRYLAIEAGAGYFESEKNGSTSIISVDTFGNITRTDFTPKVSVIPITLTLKGVVPINMVDLFIGGGGGGYYAKYKNKLETNTFGWVFDGNGNAFGYHVVGGVDINISNSLAVGAEIKHIFVKPDFDFSEFKEKIRLDGTIVNASLKYKFN